MPNRKLPLKSTSKQRTSHKKPEVVKSEDIHLVKGTGGPNRGGGPGSSYWHIYVTDKRVGYIYINVIEESPFGEHASIQIHINKDQRGRHIGRVAYKLACEISEHDEVIAHMRKSNTASKRAAEEAGFHVVEDQQIPQLAMIWRRTRKK